MTTQRLGRQAGWRAARSPPWRTRVLASMLLTRCGLARARLLLLKSTGGFEHAFKKPSRVCARRAVSRRAGLSGSYYNAGARANSPRSSAAPSESFVRAG